MLNIFIDVTDLSLVLLLRFRIRLVCALRVCVFYCFVYNYVYVMVKQDMISPVDSITALNMHMLRKYRN